MIPGLALLAIGGLLLWRGFTGRSPVDEIGRLLSGEAIFVRDSSGGLLDQVTQRDVETVLDDLDDRLDPKVPPTGGSPTPNRPI